MLPTFSADTEGVDQRAANVKLWSHKFTSFLPSHISPGHFPQIESHHSWEGRSSSWHLNIISTTHTHEQCHNTLRTNRQRTLWCNSGCNLIRADWRQTAACMSFLNITWLNSDGNKCHLWFLLITETSPEPPEHQILLIKIKKKKKSSPNLLWWSRNYRKKENQNAESYYM